LDQTRQTSMKASKYFLHFVLICVFVVLFRDTYYNGWDFEVFYHAAHAWIHGQSPYAPGRESGFVYKYPPWILPLFIPFGYVSLETAKIIWGVSQCIFLALIFLWLRKVAQVSKTTLLITSLFFWVLFAYQALFHYGACIKNG
jgi:hypothetical protein